MGHFQCYIQTAWNSEAYSNHVETEKKAFISCDEQSYLKT